MKRLFMLVLSGTIVSFAADTPVAFKDPALAAVAAKSLPAGQPEGPVSETQAPTVILLRSEDTIRDLSGIEKLTGLRFLYIAKSEISDLRPLAGLTQLESITIKGGTIADLSPLANLKKLTFLSLPGNQIPDLKPIAGLAELQ